MASTLYTGSSGPPGSVFGCGTGRPGGDYALGEHVSVAGVSAGRRYGRSAVRGAGAAATRGCAASAALRA